MPTYVYRCFACTHTFDVVKPMSAIDEREGCPECMELLDSSSRQVTKANFTGASDWNTQTFNPGLGCYTKSNRHASQIAKERGLIEVGNEAPEKIEKHFEKQRAETREQRWQEAARVKLYE